MATNQRHNESLEIDIRIRGIVNARCGGKSNLQTFNPIEMNTLYSGHHMLTYLTEEELANFKAELAKDNSCSYEDYLEKEYPSFFMFIFNAFDLDNSIKGEDYWNAIGEASRDGIDVNLAKSEAIAYAISKSVQKALEKILSENEEDSECISGEELYALMNREERSNFQEEFDGQREDLNTYLSGSYVSFKQFVGSAFLFRETKQGVKYWHDLSEKYSFDAVYDLFEELSIKVKDGDN